MQIRAFGPICFKTLPDKPSASGLAVPRFQALQHNIGRLPRTTRPPGRNCRAQMAQGDIPVKRLALREHMLQILLRKARILRKEFGHAFVMRTVFHDLRFLLHHFHECKRRDSFHELEVRNLQHLMYVYYTYIKSRATFQP